MLKKIKIDQENTFFWKQSKGGYVKRLAPLLLNKDKEPN